MTKQDFRAGPPAFDYDRAAPNYDKYRKAWGFHVGPVIELARKHAPERVLELGPGTGNSGGAFLEAYPCRLIGADRSWGMLARAREKGLPAAWLNADAHHIPLADACVDFVFGVLMLHHLTDLAVAMAECRRVLDRGCAAFVTASHSFIERHPLNAYFPSFSTIDKARFPTIGRIEAAMADAGFAETGTLFVKAPPQAIDGAYVEKVASKFISTYALIDDAEFDAGLERLRRDVAGLGALDTPLEWESVVVWGRA